MKPNKLFVLLIFLAISLCANSWGFYGHRLINRMAVFTLPEAMFGFYKLHIGYITDHAVDPDKRRYSDSTEAPRHYIDLDHYEQTYPVDTMPVYWKDAVKRYTEDTLLAYGIVPWHVTRMLARLTEAFKESDPDKIERLSAEIGHYVADACVPLHATLNYNGQLTGQTGIHGFWESRLPELFSKEYDFFTGRAQYLQNPQTAIWEASAGSFLAKDSVLGLEAALNRKFPADQKYVFEQKGSKQVKLYSPEYAKAYHSMLDGQVERRMQLAIRLVGSMWYTAWVDAGQPDLKSTQTTKMGEKERERMAEEEFRIYGDSLMKGRSE